MCEMVTWTHYWAIFKLYSCTAITFPKHWASFTSKKRKYNLICKFFITYSKSAKTHRVSLSDNSWGMSKSMVTFSVRLLVWQSEQLSTEERTNEAIELSGYAIHIKSAVLWLTYSHHLERDELCSQNKMKRQTLNIKESLHQSIHAG